MSDSGQRPSSSGRPPRRPNRGGPKAGRRPRQPASRPADRARDAAFQALTAVRERDAYANLVLPGLLTRAHLAGRDAAFATELVYGTLRWRGRLDAILTACVTRPLDQVDPPALDLLRLGAHQLLHMRVPAHAAVAETVAQARSSVGKGTPGFVNAVLRRVAERDLDAWLAAVTPTGDPVAALAVEHSHPAWIVRAFRDALTAHDADQAELADLLAADNDAPAVTLAARPGLADQAELVGLGARPGRWSPLAAILPGGDPAQLPPVRQARAGVQDEGSQLVTLALANAPLTGPDEHWLDLCAGPGGKAALLAALAAEQDTHLVAVEVSEHRAELVRNALRAIDASAWTVRHADGRQVGADEPGRYDRVLVDAPCTGLGALRRRPEARWRRTPTDLAELAPLQAALLASALRAVRPGGLVGYVTCSPHPAETLVQVGDVLRVRSGKRADHPATAEAPIAVEQVDARPLLPGVERLGDGPTVMLWPHRHGTDAMFLALLRRLD